MSAGTNERIETLAKDAIKGGRHAVAHAVSAVRRGARKLEDVKDEGVHYIKRRPIKAVTTAVGVGVAIGLAAGWITSRFAGARAAAR